jgi:hypothetical protein
MNVTQFFGEKFNTQRDQWEKSLRSELKTEEVGTKDRKTSAEGSWPILSLGAPVTHQFHPLEKWKKAAQTYVHVPGDIENLLQEDLEAGVRVFFFEKDFLDQSTFQKISQKLSSSKDAKEIVVILLGDKKITHGNTELKIIDEEKMLLGRGVSASGGNNIQELASIAHSLVTRLPEKDIEIGVFLDSQFFRNMAKVRAARLLALKVLEEFGASKNIIVTGLTSYRDWTLYERYSNLLRNDVAVASGLIAGCDYVQSAGYQAIFELETNESSPDHAERSRRMARNTSHILSLESALGVVEDASFGSYHLENLTEEYAREAWALMQKLLPMSDKEVSEFFMKETTAVREQRLKNFSTRRHVLAGINDFPDVKDELQLKTLPVSRFYRTGRMFEELRLRMESAPKKPSVYLGVFGDYAALNARINFVKNYFELLGLQVTDPHKGATDKREFEKLVSDRDEEFFVLISSDDQYESLSSLNVKAKEKYLAGKSQLNGFTSLYAGQNVLEVLTGITDRWGKK